MDEKHEVVVQHDELDSVLERCAQDGSITDPALLEAALQSIADDHDLGIWEAIKTYPQAVGWSLVAATCVIMEGYDTSLLNNFFAYRELLSSTAGNAVANVQPSLFSNPIWLLGWKDTSNANWLSTHGSLAGWPLTRN